MGKEDAAKLVSTSSKIVFDESSSEEEEEEVEIENVLADVSFEDLQKARSNGFHAPLKKKSNKKEKKQGGRENKNRPMEVSSKKPVSWFRQVIQVPKQVPRDPRFESLCGTLDPDGFKKRYSFLYETNLPTEKEDLKKLLKKSKDPEVVADLKTRISLIDKQLNAGPSKHAADKAIHAEHKKRERVAAKQGKRPYYLKPSEIREKVLIDKFNSLKAAGKLDSFIEKKRRKNASKDHRFVPYRRPNLDD